MVERCWICKRTKKELIEVCLDIIEKTANSAIELMIEQQRELLDKLRKEF